VSTPPPGPRPKKFKQTDLELWQFVFVLELHNGKSTASATTRANNAGMVAEEALRVFKSRWDMEDENPPTPPPTDEEIR
jgi:hypothetical protein